MPHESARLRSHGLEYFERSGLRRTTARSPHRADGSSDECALFVRSPKAGVHRCTCSSTSTVFARPESLSNHDLPTSKLTVVELMGASSSESFDVESINNVIEHDVGLSYMLLRFINNPAINKRYKITSLRHALNYMGEVEIKKFIALLALASLSDDKPLELLHLSLVRGKFCDLVGTEKNIGSNPPTAFLVGLFSMLDALLDQEMESLLEKLPLVAEVKEALCGGQNDLSMYLILVKAFESGNWLKVIRISKILEIDQKQLHSLFNEAILWGNGVRKSISPHFPEAKA